MITLSVALNGILLGAVYSLIALGLTVSFRLMRIVNFAHGEMVLFFAYLALGLSLPLWISLIILIFIGFTAGSVVYGALGKKLQTLPEHSQFLMFIALAIMIVNGQLFIFGGDMASSSDVTKSLLWGGLIIDNDRLIGACLSLTTIGTLWLTFYKTTFGKKLRACVDNRKAAQVYGMNPHIIFIGGFGLSFTCMAIAALLLSRIFDVNPFLGPQLTLLSFMIVILAGERYILGVLLAGITVGLSESMLGFFLGSNLKVLLTYIFILCLIAVRSSRSKECYV